MPTLTTVEIPTADGTADAYLVKPDDSGPHPAVLLFMDAFGIRPRIAEMAERIAERGYVVLAPNLFYRGVRGSFVDPADLVDADKRAAAFGKIGPLMQELTPERISADTGSYLDFLDADPDVAAQPAVITGYCMGGRNGLIAISAHPDRIGGLGSFHAGHVVTEAPNSPHSGVAAITGELYFGHADNDGSMNPDHIKALEAALDAAGITYTSEVYEGAPHGYTMSDTAMYNEAGEKRHWENLFALLARVSPVG